MATARTSTQVQAQAEMERRRRAQAARFINPDPIAWIQEHFWVPELRGPLQLAEYQQQALREALAVGVDGLFRYGSIIWSDIKKSIKSTITAGVVLWMMFQTEWGSAYIVANDLKQADSRVAYYIRRAIELNPALKAICVLRNYKITLPNHATIEAIPIDPTGEAGSNADVIVFSELWGADTKAQDRMWTEMTTSPTKFGRSFRWIETYAGFEGESLLLERLYGQVVDEANQLDPTLEIYANPEARMFALWNTTPRLPWQVPAYYTTEAHLLTPDEFNRVHRNQWASGSAQRFIDIALWKACKTTLPPLGRGTPIVIALDAGVSSDVFALVGVSRHPTLAQAVAVRLARAYVPPKGGKIDYGPIEKDLRQFCTHHYVVLVTYDPYQLHQMMTNVQQSGLVPTEEFNQGPERAKADKNLYDLIYQARIAWDEAMENAEVLTEHVSNANRKPADDQKLRIVKRVPEKKIDLTVATSMAAYRCLQLPL